MNILRGSFLLILIASTFAMTTEKKTIKSIHHLELISLDGDTVNLKKFKGKKVLFVNVASKCGFTSQYKDLQNLHSQYKENLVIIGFPCNQFGGQETGSESDIKSFCSKNYGVEFLMSAKIEVKGDKAHPIYKWLTNKKLNGVKSSTVKWNFQKYLVNESGELIDFWYSLTGPLSSKITKYL